ncbi:hypothetical protein TSUD_209400 [Trifolium subterraneum]|uniref:Uncharacterized protein n=1 Tax=Trifolium subterraneum TaxID=3900 RepID=A0A2Z6N3U2_TRISU|nr:hypothetical protein TSUD_209400 [Trifolium subterraneum]
MANLSLRELKRKIKDILVQCNSVPRKRKLDADKYSKVYMQECLKATEVPSIDFGDPSNGDIFITQHNEYRRRTRFVLRYKSFPEKNKNRRIFQNLKEKDKCKCMDIFNSEELIPDEQECKSADV